MINKAIMKKSTIEGKNAIRNVLTSFWKNPPPTPAAKIEPEICPTKTIGKKSLNGIFEIPRI